MNYRVEYLDSVVRDDLPGITTPDRKRIRQAIESKLMSHPIEFGKPLRYSLKGARSLRVGEYRVIFVIEPNHVVVVTKIGHRRDVYES